MVLPKARRPEAGTETTRPAASHLAQGVLGNDDDKEEEEEEEKCLCLTSEKSENDGET